jgi:peptide/nickel transport system permease protein
MLWRFFAGKGVQYALVLLFAVTLNFALPRMMPGSPLIFLAGEDVGFMTEAQRAQLYSAFGLDRPVWRQYAIYLGNLARGNLGHSFQQGRPVAEIILSRLRWTVLLVGIALFLATLVGIAWGTAAAWRRGRPLDLLSLGGAMLLESTPSFWLAMIFIAVFAAARGWFPVFGAMTPGAGLHGAARILDVGWHLVLPLATLTLITIPGMFLIMRYSLLTVLGEQYIATARSKGVAERNIMFRHAMRNALLPVSTVFMLNLGYIVSGATVIETVFSYPGVGRLLFEAVLARDYPVLQGTFFVVTISVIMANIAADLVYPLIDPRVRHAR